ncbi:MAG: hypothetical protein KC621_09860 [Myxococcales bacterium]|nr:hypothetical protein [Myxococcales bacterium]
MSRIARSLCLLGLWASAPALASDLEFLQTATLEELDDAGYLPREVKDVKALGLWIDAHTVLVDDELADMRDVAAELGEQLDGIDEMRAALDAARGFAILDFFPAGTSPSASGVPGWDDGLPDAWQIPSVPSGDELATDEGTWIYSGRDGNIYTSRRRTSTWYTADNVPATSTTVQEGAWWVGGVPVGGGDGSSSTVTKTVITRESSDQVQLYADDRSVVITRTQPTDKPKDKEVETDIAGDPDLADGIGGFQPADGEAAGGFCPLTFWQCRDALARAKQPATAAIGGWALVDPDPEDGYGRESAPPLPLDTQDLVSDPHTTMDADMSRLPRWRFVYYEALVNPPKPQ